MSSDVICERQGDLLNVTLNRPERGNAASDEMAATLAQTFESAPGDLRAIVIRGAGQDFCVGRHPIGGYPTQSGA